jgi:hypothetical protein
MAKRGQFKPGQSGNPKGRPRGARHRTTLAALELLNGEAEALSRKAVELALEGDTTALRLCLERIAPPCREVPVTFEIPEMVTAADASKAMAGLLKAVADGDLVPTQGAAVANLIEAFRRTLETEELESRIERLERRSGR